VTSPPDLFPVPRRWTPEKDSANTSALKKVEDLHGVAEVAKTLHPEGYRLEITRSGCTVQVGSTAAIRYAWSHLRQLQGEDPEHTPCGVLEDHPTFCRRAYMLDISRCKVPTREGFRQWLRILSELRVNELQLYTEHTFAYSSHKTVWEQASPMTPEDILWLRSEAADLGIALVPNQNCFGHFERWIQHEPYRKYAESPDGFTTPWGDKRTVGSVLKPDDASFELVKELLDELLPNFDNPRVNIGCDETFELGQGATRERCQRQGFGAVYADFVTRIMTYVEEQHGMQPEFWGDIIKKYPEEIKHLPENAVALCWGYEADSPFEEDCRVFANSGYTFTVCPGTSSWRSFAGRTDTMITNIRSAARNGYEKGAEGMLLTDWGDCGHLQQEPVSYPPLALCATLAWEGPEAPEEHAWHWCDQAAFDGREGDTHCWLEAGRVSETTGVTPCNANLLFLWFQNPDHPQGKDVSDEKIEEVLSRLDALPAPQGYSEEWDQTLRNLRLSLHLSLDHRRNTRTAENLLKEAATAHSERWLRRNRQGGLAESLENYSR